MPVSHQVGAKVSFTVIYLQDFPKAAAAGQKETLTIKVVTGRGQS